MHRPSVQRAQPAASTTRMTTILYVMIAILAIGVGVVHQVLKPAQKNVYEDDARQPDQSTRHVTMSIKRRRVSVTKKCSSQRKYYVAKFIRACLSDHAVSNTRCTVQQRRAEKIKVNKNRGSYRAYCGDKSCPRLCIFQSDHTENAFSLVRASIAAEETAKK